MKNLLRLVLLGALILLPGACKKEPLKPNVFTVSPSSAAQEHGYTHSLKLKVYCDISFKLSLSDDTWVKIAGKTAGENNLTEVELELATNEGAEDRSSTLTISAGIEKKTFEITQRPLSAALARTEIVLTGKNPEYLEVKLPAAWQIQMESAPWLKVTGNAGYADKLIVVTFEASELNFEESERVAEGNIIIGDARIPLKVRQGTSLPEGDFAEEVYGIYNYDGKGTNLAFEELSHQTNLLKSPSELIFRLIDPSEKKFYELSELPLEFEQGQRIHFVMYQNWLDNYGFRTDVNADVIRTKDDFVWLMDDNQVGFVIKK